MRILCRVLLVLAILPFLGVFADEWEEGKDLPFSEGMFLLVLELAVLAFVSLSCLMLIVVNVTYGKMFFYNLLLF